MNSAQRSAILSSRCSIQHGHYQVACRCCLLLSGAYLPLRQAQQSANAQLVTEANKNLKYGKQLCCAAVQARSSRWASGDGSDGGDDLQTVMWTRALAGLDRHEVEGCEDLLDTYFTQARPATQGRLLPGMLVTGDY